MHFVQLLNILCTLRQCYTDIKRIVSLNTVQITNQSVT